MNLPERDGRIWASCSTAPFGMLGPNVMVRAEIIFRKQFELAALLSSASCPFIPSPSPTPSTRHNSRSRYTEMSSPVASTSSSYPSTDSTASSSSSISSNTSLSPTPAPPSPPIFHPPTWRRATRWCDYGLIYHLSSPAPPPLPSTWHASLKCAPTALFIFNSLLLALLLYL